MATLTEYLKKQINPEDQSLVGSTVTPLIRGISGGVGAVVRGADNPASFTGLPQQAMSDVVRAIGTGVAKAVTPAPTVAAAPNPLALTKGESVVAPTAAPNPLALTKGESVVAPTAARVPMQPPADLSRFSPAEQQAILADATKSGASSFDVKYQTPRVGGVRNRVTGVTPVLQQEAMPEVEDGYDAAAAYKARTGIDVNALPSNALVTNLGVGQPAIQDGKSLYTGEAAAQLAEQNKILNAFYASPEGQRLAATQQGAPVEVVRGGVTSFEDFTPGKNAALRDYLFGQQKQEQLQQDYASAVAKPVGAQLTLGEAEALKATDRALQEQGSLGVAGISAGAHIRAAEIGASAGKNPLYEAAMQDIAATPEKDRATKIQQYLGGKTATATKADPMDKVYAEQLFLPEEQQAYAGLRAIGEEPAAAFAAVREKFGAKK